MIVRSCALGLLVVGLAGCSKDHVSASSTVTATATEAGTPPEVDGAVPGCEATGPVTTKLTTDDGISLEADLSTTGKRSAPGAVLLHMIPPSNDRTNYPAAFVSALVARGISVLNVDRRGAGGSAGDAKDAYLGPKGRLDAKAAIAFLLAHPCAIDPKRVAIVGASNGTTTALDYAASTDSPPRALVFLTGGAYTENQTKVAEHRALLDGMRLLFVFSTAESAWSKAFASGAPASWTFKEYGAGDHGTRMFAAEPKSIADVADFLADSLAQ
jgi:pimeloyl-ACP methyl ester carboxylesterase